MFQGPRARKWQSQDSKISSLPCSALALTTTSKIMFHHFIIRASLVAQLVKNPPAMQETWVRSLGREDPLEEGMATHSRILAWKIPTDREAWQATVHRVAKSWTQLSDQAQHSTTLL